MNVNQWTISKKLWLLTLLSSCILFIVVIFNVYKIKELTNKLNDLGQTQLPVARAMGLADMMRDALNGAVNRGIIASYKKDKTEFEDTQKDFKDFSENIIKYLNEIQQSNIDASIKELVIESTLEVQNYIKSGQIVLDSASAGKTDEAIKLIPQFFQSFKLLETKLEKLGNKIEENTNLHVKSGEDSAGQAIFFSILISVIGLISGLIISFIINKQLVSTLKSVLNRLNMQSLMIKEHTHNIDLSSQNLSDASSQQAVAIQQTASTMTQISSMAANTGENIQELTDSSKSSHDIVNKGQMIVEKMASEMNNIQQSNHAVMNQIDDSNEQIKSIVKVISEIGNKTKIINDIVFQTKLLSFNAAVEAARAGEHGKGFAVVAEEVGNLAQVSGDASREITDMLDSSLQKVSDIVETNKTKIGSLMKETTIKVQNGKNVADQCGQIFTEIVGQVSEISRVSSNISTAVKEQQTGIYEMNKAINIFNQSTKNNSVTAQNTSEISKNLKESSNDLNHLMEDLNQLVGS